MQQSFKKAPFKGAFFVYLFVTYAFFLENLWADSCHTHAINEFANVDTVFDGDTFRLQDGRKVRLVGIDTPEMGWENNPPEPLAKQAKARLLKLIGESKRIGLVFDHDLYDKYDRLLAHVYNEKGRNMSAAMLNQGLATQMLIPPNLKFIDCYKVEEQYAREKSYGLWQLPAYQAKAVQAWDGKTGRYQFLVGMVTKIKRTPRGYRLSLDSKLSIHIPASDITYFNAMDIGSLLGKRLKVRGKVFRSKQGLSMLLRHPYAMEQVN